MSRPIVLYPDPRLKLKSKPVTQFGPEMRTLAAEMTETMREACGVGLAAIQIGEAIRMMVMDVDYDKEDRGEALAMFNPEILHEEGSETIEEGCLSIPDVREDVERSFKVKVKYQDLDGKEQVGEYEGLLARCVLHEIDHMNGQLFIQKVPAVKRLFLKKQLDELKKNYKEAARL
ncbi:MAG TPA: peptide deformylase [bacterium]|nr:peptide deformylase [bacterium]